MWITDENTGQLEIGLTKTERDATKYVQDKLKDIPNFFWKDGKKFRLICGECGLPDLERLKWEMTTKDNVYYWCCPNCRKPIDKIYAKSCKW